jgi:hypothetical protein
MARLRLAAKSVFAAGIARPFAPQALRRRSRHFARPKAGFAPEAFAVGGADDSPAR